MSNEGEDAPPATAEVPEETPPGKKSKKLKKNLKFYFYFKSVKSKKL